MLNCQQIRNDSLAASLIKVNPVSCIEHRVRSLRELLINYLDLLADDLASEPVDRHMHPIMLLSFYDKNQARLGNHQSVVSQFGALLAFRSGGH